jgi:PAS domain S-box-containing protein
LNIFALPPLLSCFIALFIGITVYYKNKTNIVNIIFLWLSLFLAYSAFSEFGIRLADNLADAYFWVKMGSFWYILLSILLHFSLVFTGRLKLSKLTYLLIYTPALVFSFLDLTTNLITTEIVKSYWGWTYTPYKLSPILYAAALWTFAMMITSLYLCFRYFLKERDSRKKLQAKYICTGFSISIVIVTITDLVLPFFEISFLPLFSMAIIIGNCFIGYAIWKYQLFGLAHAFAAESIISMMADTLLLTQPNGKIVLINPTGLELLGYKASEVISQPFHVIFPEANEKDIFKQKFEKRSLQFQDVETNIKTKNGRSIPVSLSASAIREKSGDIVGLVYIARDISERKRLEAERLKIMDEVARSIAHDIRNPLQAIRNATYILREAEGEKKREMAELVDRNVVAADRIVRNLMDYTSFPPPNFSNEDVNSFLQKIFTETLLPENVKLVTHYGSIPPLKMDAGQFRRVVDNLVTNALQAMPQGGELTISTEREGDFVEIRFEDTGEGIPKDNLEKIFNPFFTTKAKGVGIGLANAKRVIEAHGGIINVESEEGKGTTIKIQLPIKT